MVQSLPRNMLKSSSMLKTAWLHRITFIYLALPVVFFFLGWLRLSIGFVFTAILVWTFLRFWKEYPSDNGAEALSLNKNMPIVLVAGAWVLLSGVGGYAFQNWDHHWRNAVFHDLINYDWPVIYSEPSSGPIKMLVYYVGYWLPAAWIGKWLGWGAANAALFLWTWLGVTLVGLHLSRRLSTWTSILLLVFFSGMDFIGALFFVRETYPSLWPPVSHLEIWAEGLQYSSFTTQLFWVFNQAVPTWLCAVAILTKESRSHAPLFWSFCFFFAPLPALGLLPFLLIEMLSPIWEDGKPLAQAFRDFLTPSTLAAVLLAGVSLIYFSSNTAAQTRGLQAVNVSRWLPFILLEGGLLWLMLFPRHRNDARWLAAGVLLVFLPFLRLGNAGDFVMRASIPVLFYLMVWSGEALFLSPTKHVRVLMMALLILGAITPLYEINRSIYRTAEYYFVPASRTTALELPVTHLSPKVIPEYEHPGRLVADSLQTLSGLQDQLSRNFIANVRRSFFYKYLSSH
jgi:hypothetical protein